MAKKKNFKEMTRDEKIVEISPKEKKFTEGKASGKEVKAALIANLNNRLAIMVEEGADPLLQYTFKELIEDIKYLNSQTPDFFEQFISEVVE